MTEILELPHHLRDLSGRVRVAEPMREHTTLKVGGPADLFFEAATADEVKRIVRFCRENSYPLTLIGNGSNLLVSDRGIRGMVVALKDHHFKDYGFIRELPDAGAHEGEGFKPDYYSVSKEDIEAADEDRTFYLYTEAGCPFIGISDYATELNLTGLEYACGIPGSIGGAVHMNAGAYGGSINDGVVMTHALTKEGEEIFVAGEDQNFRYRGSKFQDDGDIILGAIFALKKGDPEAIRSQVRDYTERRTASQPLELPSAGSTFKRPPGYYAGKLISDCNLRGKTIGGAQVSTKHAGFIVNVGGATASDINSLIRHIQETVWDRFQVAMETEVRFIGEWDELPNPDRFTQQRQAQKLERSS